MAGVIASKVRKQRSALKADTSRDAETQQQNKYLNVGNVQFLTILLGKLINPHKIFVKWIRARVGL